MTSRRSDVADGPENRPEGCCCQGPPRAPRDVARSRSRSAWPRPRCSGCSEKRTMPSSVEPNDERGKVPPVKHVLDEAEQSIRLFLRPRVCPLGENRRLELCRHASLLSAATTPPR